MRGLCNDFSKLSRILMGYGESIFTGGDNTPQIVNGDFETPDMEGWDVDADNVSQVTVDDSTVAEFDFTPPETPVTEHISQDVDVTDIPALQYKIKGSHGDGEGSGYLTIKVAGDELKTYADPQEILDWLEEELDISGYTGIVKVKVETHRDSHSNNGKMYLDNMRIGPRGWTPLSGNTLYVFSNFDDLHIYDTSEEEWINHLVLDGVTAVVPGNPLVLLIGGDSVSIDRSTGDMTTTPSNIVFNGFTQVGDIIADDCIVRFGFYSAPGETNYLLFNDLFTDGEVVDLYTGLNLVLCEGKICLVTTDWDVNGDPYVTGITTTANITDKGTVLKMTHEFYDPVLEGPVIYVVTTTHLLKYNALTLQLLGTTAFDGFTVKSVPPYTGNSYHLETHYPVILSDDSYVDLNLTTGAHGDTLETGVISALARPGYGETTAGTYILKSDRVVRIYLDPDLLTYTPTTYMLPEAGPHLLGVYYFIQQA